MIINDFLLIEFSCRDISCGWVVSSSTPRDLFTNDNLKISFNVFPLVFLKWASFGKLPNNPPPLPPTASVYPSYTG